MSAHRHRIGFGRSMLLAAIAGFAVGPFTPGLTSAMPPGASAQLGTVVRDQGPVVATTRTSRRRRRQAEHEAGSAMNSLRREIEAVVGALSGRQWNRIRRFMYRATKIPRDKLGRMADAEIIAKRCVPQYRLAARGPLLMGVHRQGVILVTSGRRAIGVPWSWLAQAAA